MPPSRDEPGRQIALDVFELPARMMRRAAMRAVVIRLSALGDVVLVEPVIRALRANGIASVDFITGSRLTPLVQRAFGANLVVPYDVRGRDRGLPGIDHVLDRMGHKTYDLVIDLQNKVRTRFLTSRIIADRKLVLRKRTALSSLAALCGRDAPLRGPHATELYLGVLRSAGLDVSGLDPRPRLLRPPEREGGPAGLRGQSRPKVRVGLCPVASHATKMWGTEGFAAVARALATRLDRVSFVAIGGPSDRAMLRDMISSSDPDSFEDTDASILDVEGLASVLAPLDLLISVDSGPAHLAAAMGVPCVVIFGPTSPERWGPIGREHRVVAVSLECAPCSNMGGARCPRPDLDHACMRRIEPAQVVDAALGALEHGS